MKIKNTNYQNLWGAMKAVLSKKFIAFNAHIIKESRSKTNNVSFHLG